MSSRARTILIVAVVAVVVIAAGVIAFVGTSGDSGDSNDGAATPSSVLPGDLGTVTVDGAALPQGDGPGDPGVGMAVPTITGTDYAGDQVTIAPGTDGPLMIVVMAHWCPHCNREVPLLVEWEAAGDVPDGLQVVGVSTAVDPEREHFPPSAWLSEDMRWPWPVIADDEAQTAAVALGTTGYPYMVFVDADGNVVARVSGELPIEDIQQLADATAATASAPG